MVPASYLFRDIYNDRWGDPDNPHAVDLPAAEAAQNRRVGFFARLIGLATRHRRSRSDAWSFTLPACSSEGDRKLHHGMR